MGLRQGMQHLLPCLGEAQAYDAQVHLIWRAFDETECLRPVSQPDHSVVPEEQVRRDVSNRRTRGVRVTPHSQQQLVLRRREPQLPGPFLAPALEAAQFSAEGEEAGVVGVGQL